MFNFPIVPIFSGRARIKIQLSSALRHISLTSFLVFTLKKLFLANPCMNEIKPFSVKNKLILETW